MTGERRIVMLIDDDEVCLAMGREILENKYTVYPVISGEKAFNILKKISPDLILLDVDMPNQNGYEVIQQLKQLENTKDIPVIFLTSHSDTGNELDGLTLGAVDYFTKPFSPPLLMQRIENHLLISSQKNVKNMIEEQTKKIKALQSVIVNTVSELIACRDELATWDKETPHRDF